MSGIQDTILLYCAFDPKVLKRLFFPYEFGDYKVVQSFITEHFDMYYLIDNIKDEQMELWYTDLDKPHGFIDFNN